MTHETDQGAGMKHKARLSSLKLFVDQLKANPFQIFDRDLIVKGKKLNFLPYPEKIRDLIFNLHGLSLVTVALAINIVMGFDSSEYQIENAVYAFFRGENIQAAYLEAYGKYVHWSAFIIYGLMFFFLSLYYERQGIKRSLNTILAGAWTSLAVLCFEFFWIFSYYIFQNQHWILNFGWPQFRILYQNIMFLVLFSVVIFYVWAYMVRFKLNLSWKTWIYLNLTIACAGLWINYGLAFPVQTLTLNIQGLGAWTSSVFFPQTVYTVDMNLLDRVVAGEQYWIQNDAIHLINTLTKLTMSLFIYSLAKVKVVKRIDQEIQS